MEPRIGEFRDFTARVIQHEMDHLMGKHIGNFKVNGGTLESLDNGGLNGVNWNQRLEEH
jgi:hypothetical protein